MVSPTHGFITQMTGKLTTVRYKYVTIYADQACRLGYVNLQNPATAEETLKGKLAFELYAKGHNTAIKGYHAPLPPHIPTSEVGMNTSFPEGERVTTQDMEQNYSTPTEGRQGTLLPPQDQSDLIVPGSLQHKMGSNPSTQSHKKLKPQQIGQISNDWKTLSVSGIEEATIPGLTLLPKPSQVQPSAALIEAMMT